MSVYLWKDFYQDITIKAMQAAVMKLDTEMRTLYKVSVFRELIQLQHVSTRLWAPVKVSHLHLDSLFLG